MRLAFITIRNIVVLIGLVAVLGGMQCTSPTTGCTDDSDCIRGDPPCMGTCNQEDGSCSWQGQACFTRE